MRLCRPFGAWVAKISPSPYLRACDAGARVLCVRGVIAPDGARVCASSMTSRQSSGRSPTGCFLIQANSAIWSWLTKLWRTSSDGSPTKLMTETRARLPARGVRNSPGSMGVPSPPKSGSFTVAAVSAWEMPTAILSAPSSAMTPSGRSANRSMSPFTRVPPRCPWYSTALRSTARPNTGTKSPGTPYRGRAFVPGRSCSRRFGKSP
jgi:hypothetical protein